MNRREFAKTLAVAAATACSTGALTSLGDSAVVATGDQSSHAWGQLAEILGRIKPPAFPDREFDVTKFGAVGDNKTDDTEAFSKAIAACAKAGGGRVVVPEGEFLTGAIRLLSNVDLHLSSAATIRFSRDTSKYPVVLTRFEGVELMSFSPFIYAFEQANIAITGEGTLDGNADGDHWWDWKEHTQGRRNLTDPLTDRDKLFEMAEKGVPVEQRVFGPGHYLRPQFIQPYRCKNVLIEGVTLLNSPMWQVHPVLSTNVTVHKLTINADGPNTDGCDPECCTDVLIKECLFNTGDDCIAIKSGRNADGRRVNVPSQNIVVQGCHMKNGHGGVTVGSEISGGVRNVFADNCQMDSPLLYSAIRIKNNAARGGDIENVYARNLAVGQVSQAALSIDFYYEEGDKGSYKPVVKNVSVDDLKTQKTKYAVYLRGFKNDPIEGISLSNCDFEGVAQGSVVENVTGVNLENVRVNGAKVDHLG
jgi:polygalacturonase